MCFYFKTAIGTKCCQSFLCHNCNCCLVYLLQYRHSAPPYVGPPQQYSVQPTGPSTFYSGPTPGDFPTAYGKFILLFHSYLPKKSIFLLVSCKSRLFPLWSLTKSDTVFITISCGDSILSWSGHVHPVSIHNSAYTAATSTCQEGEENSTCAYSVNESVLKQAMSNELSAFYFPLRSVSETLTRAAGTSQRRSCQEWVGVETPLRQWDGPPPPLLLHR